MLKVILTVYISYIEGHSGASAKVSTQLFEGPLIPLVSVNELI